MGRSLAYIFAIAGFAASAHAADLDLGSVKDPLPDTLTYKGVTIFGTIDMSYAYQTNGRPNGAIVSDLEYTPFMPTRNYTGQSISTLTANALEQSKIGIKIEEEVGGGWMAIGKFDTAFDPISGQISDGCSSFVQNAGKTYSQQNSTADTGMCGQTFNRSAYAGVSNAAYGTLTLGRQNTFQLDALSEYDPMALSYAFSLPGYSGAFAGSGSTQAARWDNAVKYIYQYGPVHAGAMYSTGGESTGMGGTGYGFNAGGAYKGFSIDATYTRENAAVNLLSDYNDTSPQNPLAAAISNNEAWSVEGKYTFDFGGGFKDDGAAAKLTLFGGYEHIDMSNSSDALTRAAGGYAITPDNNYFSKDKVLQFAWTGAKYQLPSGWSFTGAYYHVDQGAFVTHNTTACSASSPASAVQCAGTYNQGSFLVDYAFNKHFDIYTGVTYAQANDGLASGFQGTPGVKNCGSPAVPCASSGTATSVDTAAVVSGIRLKF